MKRLFYTLKWSWLVYDILSIIACYALLLSVLPTVHDEPVVKYLPALAVYAVTWITVGYLAGHYRTDDARRSYTRRTRREFVIFLISVGVDLLPWYLLVENRSYRLLLLWTAMAWLTSFLVTSVRYAYLYASDPEYDLRPVTPRGPCPLVRPARPASPDAQDDLRRRITSTCGEKALAWIGGRCDLASDTTIAIDNDIPEKAAELPRYRYDAVICLHPLSQMRGVNRLLSFVNEALPDDGAVICRLKTKSTRKREILTAWPVPLNWVIYTFQYAVHRVLPKLFLTKRLYFDITKGRERMFNLTEALGRLCYCGFDIMAVSRPRIDGFVWIAARRLKEPPERKKLRYGPLIALRRRGLGGKPIRVYKFRTMYPYSEFLQESIYRVFGLQPGGKFAHDIRVNGTGRFMRRYWIDELPMLFNLLKGDLKLVGVRPLSDQYLSLYEPDLRALRSKFKPGLLPPFYADMPKTLPEIQESERKYLTLCERQGTARTDCVYLWRIARNILFHKARSH